MCHPTCHSKLAKGELACKYTIYIKCHITIAYMNWDCFNCPTNICLCSTLMIIPNSIEFHGSVDVNQSEQVTCLGRKRTKLGAAKFCFYPLYAMKSFYRKKLHN